MALDVFRVPEELMDPADGLSVEEESEIDKALRFLKVFRLFAQSDAYVYPFTLDGVEVLAVRKRDLQDLAEELHAEPGS